MGSSLLLSLPHTRPIRETHPFCPPLGFQDMRAGGAPYPIATSTESLGGGSPPMLSCRAPEPGMG